MPTIRYASEADRPVLGAINVEAFASSGFLPNTFPQAGRDGLRAFKGAMSLKHLADPKTHVLVATEPESGTVVGYCRWVIPQGIGYDCQPEPLSDEGAAAVADPMQFAPRPMNEGVYNAFKSTLEEKRKEHATDDDLILDFLATLPAHQGKGVGSMFLRWGLDKADAAQRRVYLEATPEGYPLYCKYGWRAVERVMVDFAPHGGEGSQSLVIMMRDPDFKE
ncbi:hypothetical protein PHISP_03355 [Aspergillus sp. HF37]|nr:hypothetical protein PHISP_03355 [Aspergillus sp. HF37]